FALWPLMFMGEVPEIMQRLPRLLKEANDRNDLYAATNLCLVIRPFVRLAEDEPERARLELSQVMDRWPQEGFHVQHMNREFDETRIDLYLGDGPAAWRRLTAAWPKIVGAHMLLVQQVKIFLQHLRGGCALAAALAAGEPGRSSLVAAAERDGRLLRRERLAWADALAGLLRAGVAQARGDKERAAALLREAAAGCEATEMRLYAAAARLRLGQVLGGGEGQALREQAAEWMKGKKVQNPARMTALLGAGFAEGRRPGPTRRCRGARAGVSAPPAARTSARSDRHSGDRPGRCARSARPRRRGPAPRGTCRVPPGRTPGRPSRPRRSGSGSRPGRTLPPPPATPPCTPPGSAPRPAGPPAHPGRPPPPAPPCKPPWTPPPANRSAGRGPPRRPVPRSTE